jgi:hypothetical protein
MGISCKSSEAYGRQQISTRIVFFVAGFGLASWAPLVPFAKAHVGIDEGALGLVLLCLGAGSITTLPMAGALAARFGCRQVVIGSAVPLCLTLPLLATAATPVALAVGLFVFGAALGAIDVTMNIQAIIVERRSGRSMMSSFHGLFSVGSIAGPSCMVSQGAKRNLGTEPLSRTEPAAPNNRRRHAAEAGDFRLKPGLHRTRNRKFESVSLQRRVCCEPDPLDQGAELQLADHRMPDSHSCTRLLAPL